MRILITGTNGLLGFDLYKILLSKKQDIYGLGRTTSNFVEEKKWLTCDITDPQKTFLSISKLNPDILIHTAAYSDVDGCEKDPEMAYKINSLGTRNVAVACQRFDTTMVYISTDYIFDGEIGKYSEFDTPNPINIYGKSKYLGEIYVKEMLNKFFIVRVAWLFGKNRENFVTKVVKSILEKKEITVIEDQTGSPTYTFDVANAISELIDTNCYGTYHVVNNGEASRKEMVEEIFKIVEDSTKIRLMKRDKFYYAKRPKNSSLKGFFWKLSGFKELRSWKLALREFIKSNYSLR